jgi:hypothetical protein
MQGIMVLFALDCGLIHAQAPRSFEIGVSFVYMFFIIFGWSSLSYGVQAYGSA